MNYKLLFLTISLFTSQLAAEDTNYKAVCIVPVANLFGEAMHQKYPILSSKAIAELYTFTQAPVNNSDCLRIHQLLFHETVTVTKELENEVCIQIHNIFHDNNFWDGKQSTYWTLKEYLIPVESIENAHLLPIQFDYTNLETFEPQEKSIFTLTEPFKDLLTNETYSVRTRFVILNATEEIVTVARYNQQTNTLEQLEIPTKYGVTNQQLTPEKAAQAVVGLLKNWAQKKEMFATLLGGCSGTTIIKPGQAAITEYTCTDQIAFKAYCNQQVSAPYSGFDAPGLIMSACQIFHVPFCAKNTVTTLRYLRPFNESQDSLEVGDMIMTKGYLGMIVDIEKKLIVEARSNTFHDGTIRITSLKNTFSGVNTYQELLNKYLAKDSLTLTDKHGNGILTLPFTILKFNSIFDPYIWRSPQNLFNWSVN
jgi:hypothetical protein